MTEPLIEVADLTGSPEPPARGVVANAAELFAGDNLVVVAANAAFCLHFHHDGALTFARSPGPAAGEEER